MGIPITNATITSARNGLLPLRAYIKPPKPETITPDGVQYVTPILADAATVWVRNDIITVLSRDDFATPFPTAYTVSQLAQLGLGSLAYWQLDCRSVDR